MQDGNDEEEEDEEPGTEDATRDNNSMANQEEMEDDDEEEEMTNDLEIRNLYKKLKAVEEDPKTATENIRVVHKELAEKHIQDRLVAKQAITKRI